MHKYLGLMIAIVFVGFGGVFASDTSAVQQATTIVLQNSAQGTDIVGAVFSNPMTLIIVGVFLLAALVIVLMTTHKIKIPIIGVEVERGVQQKFNDHIRAESFGYDNLRLIIKDVWEPIYNYVLTSINGKTYTLLHQRDNTLLLLSVKLTLSEYWKQFKCRFIQNHFYDMDNDMLDREVEGMITKLKNNLQNDAMVVSSWIEKYNQIDILPANEMAELKRMFHNAIKTMHHKKLTISKQLGVDADEINRVARKTIMV